MKRAISILLIVSMGLLASGCARPMTICGNTYGSYGILNAGDEQNPDVKYEVVWGNVFWGVVLFETIIAPIYFFGFSLFEPVGTKPAIKGTINNGQACPAGRVS